MAETPKMKVDVDVSVNLGPIAMVAVEMHETFMSFVSAGFTREESLTILLDMMKMFKPEGM